MHNWEKVRERLSGISPDSYKKKSVVKSFEQIIDVAEEWGLDPTDAEKGSISNLIEIITEAKMAIEKGDKQRLQTLFSWAAKYPTTALRIELRGNDLETLVARTKYDGMKPHFVLDLTKEQYERIKKAAMLYYRFIEEDNQ